MGLILAAVFALGVALSVAVRLMDRPPTELDTTATVSPSAEAPATRLAQSASPAGIGQTAGAADSTEPAGAEPPIGEEQPPPEGIHLFPPKGTRPPLTGIIVPDDFELPPGYVRHHQTTDDGQQLPPILMYHPRRPPLDANGEPIPVTPDRVVPPEMAPPGLPVVMLELPEPEPPRSGLESLLKRQ
jgi:hypothetical protein